MVSAHPSRAGNGAMTKSNKEIVLEVLKRAFIDRDPTVVEQYFGANHKQHNPVIPDGPSAIAEMIPTLTALKYEPGMAVADGDLVMVHGRYTGWGPKPMVAVDIFRVAKWQSCGTLGRFAGGSLGRRYTERERYVHKILSVWFPGPGGPQRTRGGVAEWADCPERILSGPDAMVTR
jgi:predicted SnoaL-like aldol condensation-catalyzing enzyme